MSAVLVLGIDRQLFHPLYPSIRRGCGAHPISVSAETDIVAAIAQLPHSCRVNRETVGRVLFNPTGLVGVLARRVVRVGMARIVSPSGRPGHIRDLGEDCSCVRLDRGNHSVQLSAPATPDSVARVALPAGNLPMRDPLSLQRTLEC
jgi:hypothetical protein